MNTHITFNSTQFKKTLNQWEFITAFEKYNHINSDIVSFTFKENGIVIIYEKEAHMLDLTEIAEIIGCKFAIIGIDEFKNNIICGV